MNKYIKAIRKSLKISIDYRIGETFQEAEVGLLSAGTIESIDHNGVSGFKMKVNNTVVTPPYVLEVGDIMRIEFNESTIDGTVVQTGYYA